MAMSARASVKICSPSPVMVTSPYEWKILERDENLETNNQNKQKKSYTFKNEFQNFYIFNIDSSISKRYLLDIGNFTILSSSKQN